MTKNIKVYEREGLGGKGAIAEAVADERYRVPALARGLALLEAFGADRKSLSLVELSRAIGLSRSSAYRLVFTLSELGFLVREPESKNYRLGARVLNLGFTYLASQELIELARPHLEALRDTTNCSAHLGVLDGTDIVYVARVPDHKALTSRVHVGTRLPAHATSMGRAMLSRYSEADVRARFKGKPLKSFTSQTATTLDALVARLAEDRTHDVIISRGAFESGIASVAAPLLDAEGRAVAAINISTPASTLRGRELETSFTDAVRAAAQAISQWLGHKTKRAGL
ncbi:MAG: IclR family transcriptional regulator [Alphaproteobacteria bacterium]